MDNAARMRQRVLALFLPLAAVLYVSAEALNPKGTDQVISTTADALKVLAIAARHPAQLYVSGSLSLLALGALAVSFAAIATLVRGRGSALATVAALFGGVGAFCGALVNVLVGVNLAAAATAHMSQGRGRALPGDVLQFRVRARLLWPLLRRHLRRAGPDGDCPVAQPERAALAGGPVRGRPGGRPAGLICRARRRPVHAAVRGGDGAAGSPDVAGRRPGRHSGSVPAEAAMPGRPPGRSGLWPVSWPSSPAASPLRRGQPRRVNCEDDGGVSFWKAAENPRRGRCDPGPLTSDAPSSRVRLPWRTSRSARRGMPVTCRWPPGRSSRW